MLGSERALATITAVAALAACREPTEIVVEITTDVPCEKSLETQIRTGRELDEIELADPVAATPACEPSGRIGSLVLVPKVDDTAPVAVKIVTVFPSSDTTKARSCALDGKGAGCIVARRTLHFIPHTKLVLPIAMESACENTPCPAGETCFHGVCRPALIPDPTICAGAGCPNPFPPSPDGGALADAGVADVGAFPDVAGDRVVPPVVGDCRPGAARCRASMRERCGLDGKWQPSTSECVAVLPTIAAGASHTCALRDDGRVQCWGLNNFGQLGLGDNYNRGDEPDEMGSRLPTVDLGPDRYAYEIVARGNRSCAVLDDETLKCWGHNSFGELGFADTSSFPATGDEPGEMGESLRPVDFGSGLRAIWLALGRFHSCAALNDGQVKCWGNNEHGELGLGDVGPRSTGPRDLPAVDLGLGREVTRLVAGARHTCALLADPNSGNFPADLKCWGYNAAGALGLEDRINRGDRPGQMGKDLPFVNLGTEAGQRIAVNVIVTSGADHTCAVVGSASDRLKCWGANADGQLGLGDKLTRGDAPNQMGDRLLPALAKTMSEDPLLGTSSGQGPPLAAGQDHTCVIFWGPVPPFGDPASTGLVGCWGTNTRGQLGLGTLDGGRFSIGDKPGDVPNRVGFGRLLPIAIAAGDSHTCVLLSDNRIRCWGGNEQGQLGLGDTFQQIPIAGDGEKLYAVDLGP